MVEFAEGVLVSARVGNVCHCGEDDGGHQQEEGEADELVLYEVAVRAELIHKLRIEFRVFPAGVGEVPTTEVVAVVAGDWDPVGDSLGDNQQADGGGEKIINGIFLLNQTTKV